MENLTAMDLLEYVRNEIDLYSVMAALACRTVNSCWKLRHTQYSISQRNVTSIALKTDDLVALGYRKLATGVMTFGRVLRIYSTSKVTSLCIGGRCGQ
jgi:hypothetical protein